MESIKEKAKKYAEEHCHAEPWLAYQAGYMEGFAAGSKHDKNTKKVIPAYTYKQLATLNLQLQGLITAKDEAYYKIVTENEYLRNKIRLIEKVLNNE